MLVFSAANAVLQNDRVWHAWCHDAKALHTRHRALLRQISECEQVIQNNARRRRYALDGWQKTPEGVDLLTQHHLADQRLARASTALMSTQNALDAHLANAPAAWEALSMARTRQEPDHRSPWRRLWDNLRGFPSFHAHHQDLLSRIATHTKEQADALEHCQGVAAEMSQLKSAWARSNSLSSIEEEGSAWTKKMSHLNQQVQDIDGQWEELRQRVTPMLRVAQQTPHDTSTEQMSPPWWNRLFPQGVPVSA